MYKEKMQLLAKILQVSDLFHYYSEQTASSIVLTVLDIRELIELKTKQKQDKTRQKPTRDIHLINSITSELLTKNQ